MIEDAWLFKIFSSLRNTGWLKTRKLFQTTFTYRLERWRHYLCLP